MAPGGLHPVCNLPAPVPIITHTDTHKAFAGQLLCSSCLAVRTQGRSKVNVSVHNTLQRSSLLAAFQVQWHKQEAGKSRPLHQSIMLSFTKASNQTPVLAC